MTSPDPYDLELSLHRRDAAGYTVEFRFNQPGSEADTRLEGGQAVFDLDELAIGDPASEEYARLLSAGLFGDARVAAAFNQAWAAAQSAGAALRLRLLVSPSAAELHSLCWERLHFPGEARPLAADLNLRFSRYLSSLDMRPVRLRRRADFQILAAVANPSDLAAYRLAPIDPAAELGRLQRALAAGGPANLESLPDDGSRAGLGPIFERLVRQGRRWESRCDVLYLVCHGALVKGEPYLWLEGEDGKAAQVHGGEFAARFKELESPPALVVLDSCESAGEGSGAALAAIGPRLAEAGVPAVLAMQGRISAETSGQFMSVFFQELAADGRIDRAVAAGRGAVRQRPDGWMPALFMRLQHGRLWYTPGFSTPQDEFEKWDALRAFIQEGACTPIVGAGLNEVLLGDRREIALRWAERHGYPLAPYDREDFPHVAQFVASRLDPMSLRSSYREALREELLARYGTALPEALRSQPAWPPPRLAEAISLAAGECWKERRNPYAALAALRLPIYINTTPTSLLEEALRQAGAEPQARLCPWNEFIPKAKCLYDDIPTAERPLVYNLFGQISDPMSLVLTQDEYFDFLIGMTANRDLVPKAVRAALTSTALLFVGFSVDSWAFRVFFRLIMAQEGRDLLRLYSHASAQIEPAEGRVVDSARARRYLEKYIEAEKISLYWGSSEDFLNALQEHMQ